MNLMAELDRRTEPPFAASKVKMLTPEEIAEISKAGRITPPDLIPQAHLCRREVVPTRWGRGTYYGYRGRL